MVANKPANPAYLFMVFWAPVALCIGIIFCISSLPAKDIPSLFFNQDVVYHVSIYLLTAFLFSRALRQSFPNAGWMSLMLTTLLFGVALGITDEQYQVLIPGRCPSLKDIMSDSAGTFFGGLAYI